jgi:hypothetical protein
MPDSPPYISPRVRLAAIAYGVGLSVILTPVAAFVGMLAASAVSLSTGGVILLIGILTTVGVSTLGATGAATALGSFGVRDPHGLAVGVAAPPLCGALFATAGFWIGQFSSDAIVVTIVLITLAVLQALAAFAGCESNRRDWPKVQRGIGHTCANCNYDLTATAKHQPCPECGNTYRLAPPDSATSTNQPPYTPRTPNPPTYNPPN